MSFVSKDEINKFIISYLTNNLIEKNIDHHDVDENFDFVATGTIDSISLLDMISAMETFFNITVDFEQMNPETFTVIGPFCNYVSAKAIRC